MPSLKTPVSLYLHIPFCGTKCTYCAFNTYTNLEALIPAFVDALCRELTIVGNSQPGIEFGTIFFGGGTPSLLTAAQYAQIFETIRAHFSILPNAEITLEANPSDMSEVYAAQLRGVGFNRISIGMQSALASELALFNRRHDNDAVARAVHAARAGGFHSLNLDLIYGIPHQTMEGWGETLNAALALKPEHLSIYGLGIEDGTPMKTWVERGTLPTPDDDLAADMYEWATERLEAAGHRQYEISNWALPGYECRHNLQYWLNLDYIAVGPGGHGYAAGVRYWTIRSPQRYISLLKTAPLEGWVYPRTPVTEEANVLDQTAEIAETMLMGLRLTDAGMMRADFRARFGVDMLDVHRATLEKYAQYGLLTVDDARVRLTSQGRLLSNMIFRELV